MSPALPAPASAIPAWPPVAHVPRVRTIARPPHSPAVEAAASALPSPPTVAPVQRVRTIARPEVPAAAPTANRNQGAQ